MANEVGRPSEFKPEYIQGVEDHLAKGYSLETYGAVIGVGRTTIYNWASQHIEFLYAIQKGRERGQHEWEQRLEKMATGKMQKGNVTAAIFAMKCLYPSRWKEKTEGDIVDRLAMSGSSATATTMTPEEKLEYAKRTLEQLQDFVAANEPARRLNDDRMDAQIEVGQSAVDVVEVPLAESNSK